MGGACGNMKKNMPSKKTPAKKVIIKGRQISIKKQQTSQPVQEYNAIVNGKLDDILPLLTC